MHRWRWTTGATGTRQNGAPVRSCYNIAEGGYLRPFKAIHSDYLEHL
jgi:hypothetical protein